MQILVYHIEIVKSSLDFGHLAERKTWKFTPILRINKNIFYKVIELVGYGLR